MRTSQRGVDLIKSFEGLSLRAVRLQGEQYYTIGYGHYGPDVPAGQVITEAYAESLLRKDLQQFEVWVNQYATFGPNQNQFDALVSFTYNCGPGSLITLVSNRTPAQIAAHMLAYTNSGSEAYRQGLLNRRRKEQALFLAPAEEDEDMERWKTVNDVPAGYYREQVQRLMAKGIIKGKADGTIDITEDMLRTLLMAERLS